MLTFVNVTIMYIKGLLTDCNCCLDINAARQLNIETRFSLFLDRIHGIKQCHSVYRYRIDSVCVEMADDNKQSAHVKNCFIVG